MRNSRKDMAVIGFALFSTFFGAGNVIFPPYLGLGCGRAWFTGFLWYYLADIGLALTAIFAIGRAGSAENVLRPLGEAPAKALMIAIVLCIGPMLAIPRTAATTHEMAVSPLISGVQPLPFSLLFFALIALICVKQSAVVDIVGKFLTPALLAGLLVLIVLGVVNPIGAVPDRVLVESVAQTGIEAGYQTMDVLAAILCGSLLLKSAEEKGYSDPRSRRKVISGAAVIAGLALLGVYLGLTYLGVTASRFFDLTVQRTFLVVAIVRNLMGTPGVWLFSVIVALACITTAAALLSAAADYFSALLHRSYTGTVLFLCAFSAAAASLGLETIVSIASPILSIVYPPTLVAIAFSFFALHHTPVRLAALGALAVSAAQTAGFLSFLPLSALGFGWLIPALLCGGVGLLFPPAKQKPAR